jgi:hypothetical protein
MACLCGDTHCWSCGPAQGNTKCPICNAWADDGCEHVDDDGAIKPEFKAAEAAAYEADRLAAEAEAKQGAEDERLAEEYWKSLDEEGKPRV